MDKDASFKRPLTFLKNTRTVMYVLFSIIVLLSLTGIGFYHYYSAQTKPLYQAEKQQVIDDITASSVKRLQSEVSTYTQEKGELPKDLTTIFTLLDSEIKQSIQQAAKEYDFTYHVKGKTTYELCANFLTDTKGKEYKGLFGEIQPYDPVMNHPKGKSCFEETVLFPSVEV